MVLLKGMVIAFNCSITESIDEKLKKKKFVEIFVPTPFFVTYVSIKSDRTYDSFTFKENKKKLTVNKIYRILFDLWAYPYGRWYKVYPAYSHYFFCNYNIF